jgi:hypothetical protein
MDFYYLLIARLHLIAVWKQNKNKIRTILNKNKV